MIQKPRSGFLTALAALSALLLAACEAEGPQSSQIYASPRGTIDLMVNASRENGTVPIKVIAAPQFLRTDIADVFSRLIRERNRNISPAPGASKIESDGQDPRILLMHATPDGYTAISACQGKPYIPVDNNVEITLRVAICYSDARLVEVLAGLKIRKDSVSQDYDALLRQIVPQILIPQDRSR